jgi:ribosomal protein S14
MCSLCAEVQERERDAKRGTAYIVGLMRARVITMGRVPGGAGPAGWWSWTSELVELDQRAGGAGSGFRRVSVQRRCFRWMAFLGDVTGVTYAASVGVTAVTCTVGGGHL